MGYYIDISKENIPYIFNILLNDELYDMRVDYNNTANLFTVSLSKNGVELCAGEPIIYGVPLFQDLVTRGDFPTVVVTPVDESGENNAVTYDNLSRTVFLIVTGGEYGE